ncbi:MAG: zinc ribbon domain-containing protein [Pseudomonadota bacterium]|nr:zinc ribbon domain-containing protein [Pseudomonadota bacterium]
MTHDFAFSGLIACAKCGCSVVGEIKKQRYVYYHCTGYADKCQGNSATCRRRYVREEVLESQFTALLGRLQFDDEVLAWRARRCTPAMPMNGASTRRRSGGSRPNTSGSVSASMPCISTSSTGVWMPSSSTRCPPSGARSRTAACAKIERHESAEQSYMDEGVQISRTRAERPTPVRAPGTAPKTPPAQLCTIELYLGARRGGRHLPPTI